MEFFNIFGDTAISIIGFLLILSFLVIIHELGHFLTALWLKVRIEEFGIGYPPVAKTLFHWKGIPFTLNWLPFGGFVKMQGEDGPEEDVVVDNPTGKDNEFPEKKGKAHHLKLRDDHQAGFQPFYEKSRLSRLIVLLAGVTINFLFGILAFALVYTIKGFPRIVNERELVIDQVMTGSPAEVAGIEPGDKVSSAIAIESDDQTQQTFQTNQEFITYVEEHLGQKIKAFVVKPEGTIEVEVYLRPRDARPEGEGALGVGFVQPVVLFDFYPWWQMPFRGIAVGFQESLELSKQILLGFKTMFGGLIFRGTVPKDVAGPIGIVHQATKYGLFENGWEVVLKFSGMLSVNLAILNFLPIPALDGGRAFFVVAEKFIGRKKREFIEGKVNTAGFVFLLSLIFLISIKDIWAIVTEVSQFFSK